MVETLISEETATRHVDACFHSVYVNTQKNNFFRVGMFRLAKKKKREREKNPCQTLFQSEYKYSVLTTRISPYFQYCWC